MMDIGKPENVIAHHAFHNQSNGCKNIAIGSKAGKACGVNPKVNTKRKKVKFSKSK